LKYILGASTSEKLTDILRSAPARGTDSTLGKKNSASTQEFAKTNASTKLKTKEIAFQIHKIPEIRETLEILPPQTLIHAQNCNYQISIKSALPLAMFHDKLYIRRYI